MTVGTPHDPRWPLLPVVPSHRVTILLVDHDDKARRAARRAFEAQGFLVVEARTGNHAIRMCEWVVGQVDLLIAEVAISRPNGVALAEAITAWWPRAVVLLMSDRVVAAVAQYAGEQRVWPVLQRPLPVDELIERARRALVAR